MAFKAFTKTRIRNLAPAFAATFAASAALLMVGGCGDKPASAAAESDFALVTIDGDFSAGEMRKAFPGLNVLTEVRTPSPFTLPAATTLLTGLAPQEHGLRVDGAGALAPGTRTIATDKAKSGYTCAAFLSSFALAPIHGLTNGFAKYDLQTVANPAQAPRTRTARETVDAAAAWLGETKAAGKPRFVWVHLPREENTLAETARLFSLLPANSSKAVVPLFGNGENRMFSLDDPVILVNAAVSDPSPLPTFDTARPGAARSENLMPWHLFRMPPLVTDTNYPPEIPFPATMEQATFAGYYFLRANGHFGEGLIPPLPPPAPAAVTALSPADADFAARALAALASDGTNTFAAVSALADERPGIPALHSRLGAILFAENKFIEAYGEFAKADDAGLNMTQAVRMMAKCHIAIGNVMPAIDQAENAFLMNPADAMLRRELSALLLNVGTSLFENKQYASASDFFTRVNFLEPKNPQGLFAIAQLHLATGQTNSAAAYLKEIQTLRPNDKRAAAILKAIGK